jgi:uroporphyrinogen-III synthase
MRLLITRPADDGEALAARLTALGHEPIAAPVMEIIPRDMPPLSLDGIAGFLVTSRNGARMLARTTARRDLPVYAVGDESAAEAKAAGFVASRSADGDVTSLIALVIALVDPAAGPLLHVAGSAQAGDLSGALTAKGFTVRRAVFYESRALLALPEAARKALQAGLAEGVLFYSPRTAKLFGTLAQAAGLGPSLGALSAYCLSKAVADAAAPFGYRTLRWAAKPKEAELLALIQA